VYVFTARNRREMKTLVILWTVSSAGHERDSKPIGQTKHPGIGGGRGRQVRKAAVDAWLGGLLLLFGYCVPLALTVLAAELYNILAFHMTLAPATIAPALVASVLWLLVFLQYRDSFRGIFSAKPATQS
jgi:hypothetical protein